MEVKCKSQISIGNGQINLPFFQLVACESMQVSVNNLVAVMEVL